MQFALLVLLTAVLFIRPSDLIPAWEKIPMYQMVILACIASSYPLMTRQLQMPTMTRRPVTLCLVCLWMSVCVSSLLNANFYECRYWAMEFAKLLILYLLMISVIRSSEMLDRYLSWLLLLVAIQAVLAILQYHGVIHVEALAAYQQREIDEITGEVIEFARLCGAGMFHDPNDVCLLFNVAILLGLSRIEMSKKKLVKLLWACLMGMFFYGILCTQSRGGLLALGAGLGGWTAIRFGIKRLIPFAVIGFVGLIVAGGERITRFEVDGGTGQHRIHLWRDALSLFVDSPIVGIGTGLLPEYTRLVAHNSYVHAFAELGLLGGCAFVGAITLSIKPLIRGLRWKGPAKDAQDIARLASISGAMISFAFGIVFLSRVYVVPTYFMMALAVLVQTYRNTSTVTTERDRIETKAQLPVEIEQLVKKSKTALQETQQTWTGILFRVGRDGVIALIILEVGSRLLVNY